MANYHHAPKLRVRGRIFGTVQKNMNKVVVKILQGRA